MTRLCPRSSIHLACVALLAFAVGACGAPAPTSTPPAPTSAPPAPTSASTSAPASPGATIDLDDRHADPELEARLPEVLGGVALVRESQLGVQITRESAAFDAFLATVGGTLADFSLASAYSAGGDLRAQVGAWRVHGADPSMLRDAFVAALQASSATPLDVTDLTIADTPVTRIGTEGQLAQGSMYAWVDGDTILFVQTPDPALAEEAMAKLRALALSSPAAPASPAPSAAGSLAPSPAASPGG